MSCSSRIINNSAMRRSSSSSSSCPICLNRFKDSITAAVAVLTVCNHAYCVNCIRKWSQLKRNCPLCNALFDSWFLKPSSRSRFSSTASNFEKLPDLNDTKKINDSSRSSPSETLTRFSSRPRVLRGLTRRRSSSSQRSRPLPWRRSFASRSEDQRCRVERYESVIRWRASIYSERLQAVPLPREYCLDQKLLLNNSDNVIKEKKCRQLEQWIQRELQAILGDSDPSVIVHLCMSIYFSSIKENYEASSNSLGDESKFLEQLKPFLYERTTMFWHEQRCFAQSVFDVTTYDSVVAYRQMDSLNVAESPLSGALHWKLNYIELNQNVGSMLHGVDSMIGSCLRNYLLVQILLHSDPSTESIWSSV